MTFLENVFTLTSVFYLFSKLPLYDIHVCVYAYIFIVIHLTYLKWLIHKEIYNLISQKIIEFGGIQFSTSLVVWSTKGIIECNIGSIVLIT